MPIIVPTDLRKELDPVYVGLGEAGVPLVPERDISDGAERQIVGLLNRMPEPVMGRTIADVARMFGLSSEIYVDLRLVKFDNDPREAVGRSRAGQLQGFYAPLSEVIEDINIVFSTGDNYEIDRDTGGLLSFDRIYYHTAFEKAVQDLEDRKCLIVGSCLSAHELLYRHHQLERIKRDKKIFGIFEHTVTADSPLMSGIESPFWAAHSRVGDIPVDDVKNLANAVDGFKVLAESREAGWFAVEYTTENGVPVVCLNAHPEYDPRVLGYEGARDDILPAHYYEGDNPKKGIIDHREQSIAVRLGSNILRRSLDLVE